MQVVNDAMRNISHEQMNEFKRERERFIDELATDRKDSGGFFNISNTAPGWLSATPKQYKPTKAEKKQSKRERRVAYPY